MTSSSFTEVRRHSPEAPWTYLALDERQRAVAARVRKGGPGALLLSEVAPVITLGRRAASTELLLPQDQLEREGISVLRSDRGGLATYHGPGQWVLFAVDSLERLTGDRRGVRKAVQGLLEVACDACRESEPRAEIREGAYTGVWGPRGKLASVGVHIEDGVLLHGLWINGFRAGTSFRGVRPCGLDLPVAYLLDDVAPEPRFAELGRKLASLALARFWAEPKPRRVF